MRKNFVMVIGAMALIASATSARAGAYGDREQAEEAPAPAPAVAAMQEVEEVDYARPGFYIGLGGNYAIEQFDATGIGNDGNSTGLHARAGYRIVPNFAIEALYEWMSEFDEDSFPGIKTKNHYSAWAITLNAKGYLLTGRWQPYLVYGLGYIDVNGHNVQNNTGTGEGLDMRFGIGMDANINENIAIGPEVAYVLPFQEAANFDMVTVALGIRFKF